MLLVVARAAQFSARSRSRGQTVSTIRSSREIDRLFASARRATNKFVIVLVATTPEGRGPEGRVAFVAGKKLGNAPLRNRSKRVLRATAAALGAPWAGHDVVLIARAGTAAATSAELRASLEHALHKAGLAR